MTFTTTSHISDEFDAEADPRVAQGIKDLMAYSGYSRIDFQEATRARETAPAREPTESSKPSGAFGS